MCQLIDTILIKMFQDFHAFVHPTLNELRKSIKQQNTAKVEVELTAAILKSVVGYLGTIEMPPKDGVTGDKSNQPWEILYKGKDQHA
jgi:hypothetical protein